GCTIWYNEPKLLADIEEHLGQTIATVDCGFQIPVDEFDGKIVYGAKRANVTTFEGHAPQLAVSVAQLADLERALQSSYLAAVGDRFRKIVVT
ncbi:ATP-dependent RNA helicase DDX1, partial [Trichostrongylus colubriformis]